LFPDLWFPFFFPLPRPVCICFPLRYLFLTFPHFLTPLRFLLLVGGLTPPPLLPPLLVVSKTRGLCLVTSEGANSSFLLFTPQFFKSFFSNYTYFSFLPPVLVPSRLFCSKMRFRPTGRWVVLSFYGNLTARRYPLPGPPPLFPMRDFTPLQFSPQHSSCIRCSLTTLDEFFAFFFPLPPFLVP